MSHDTVLWLLYYTGMVFNVGVLCREFTARGPRVLKIRRYAPLDGASSLACVLTAMALGDHILAGIWAFRAAHAGWRWWNNRPPRPPRRRTVLATAGAR